jgi:hypothetical protein
MGEKVGLTCKSKTLLVAVNKRFEVNAPPVAQAISFKATVGKGCGPTA